MKSSKKTLRRHPSSQQRYEHLQVVEALKEIDREAERRRKRQVPNWVLEERMSEMGRKYERYLVASAERQAKRGGDA